jgi:hypothetical protein
MRYFITRPEQLPPIYHQIEQALTEKKRLSIEVKTGGTRSVQQNRYLWGVVYPTILGELHDMEGWRNEDLHEYMLGECFGWETLEGFGRKRIRPINRSSNLTKPEFVDYVAFIQQKMAEIGIEIPDPA